MATPKQEMQALQLQLTINNASLQTKKSSRQTALDISTDPKASPARRAEFKAKYEKLVGEIKDIEEKIDSNQKKMNKMKAVKTLSKYDKVEGQQKISEIKEQYALLSEAYKFDKNPSIKSSIDALVEDYKDVYTSVIGTPISLPAARSILTGQTPALDSTVGTVPAAGPVEAVKPGAETVAKTADTPVVSGKSKVPSAPKTPKVPLPTAAEKEAEALGAAAGADFTLPETIFKNVPSLQRLLQKYSDPKLGMTRDQFLKELRDDVWYKKNSAEIKNRYIQLYNYRDLKASGQADGSTDYEKQIATITRQLSDKARAIGSGIASDPEALARAAENMYITNQGVEDAMTVDFLAAAIRPIGSTIGGKATSGYSGQALQNYQTLQSAAKANGFSIADIIPGGSNEQQVLAGIATGAIDINRVAQDARKLAAQGQPQYVRDLLGQGYNLDQVYAPYRQTMASILEVQDPNQIDLNDPTLRMAITDKGDMNLYDFKKALKKDNRWQYTENARQEVSSAAFQVLRDFGFQG
jgi:hypothetical protein